LLLRTWSLATGFALALLACQPAAASPDGGPDAGPCSVGFLGDEAGAPDFDMLVLDGQQTPGPLQDGGVAPMVAPPQGGRVIFVGVRATNVDGCGLQLTGALRDLATQQVRVDSRTVDLIPTGDGYGVSGAAGDSLISNFSNVAVCPNEWSATNVYGTAYGLEVTIQDREGRQVTRKIVVTPECGQPAEVAECECICQGGYVLGAPCDAGASE